METVTVRGYYVEKVFFDSASGYSSFYLKPADFIKNEYIFSTRKNVIKIVGLFCLEQKFLPLTVTGTWQKTNFGYELKADRIDIESNAPGTDRALVSEMGVKDAGKVANKIAREVGGRLTSLLFTKGIEAELVRSTNADETVLAEVFAKLREMIMKYKTFQLISSHGGTYEVTEKIIKAFPVNAYQLLLTDPYKILDKIPVPFDVIDSIAKSIGIDMLSESRIQALVYWSVKRETSSGNVYMTLNDICKKVQIKDSNVPSSAIISSLKNHPYVIRSEDLPDNYYLKPMLRDETNAAKDFCRLMFSRVSLPWHPEYIDKIEEENGRKLGSQQRSAFNMLRSTGFKVLTGGPGTGKSTTADALLRYLERVWDDKFGRAPVFALCAPSGRAAQRLKETTHRNALTVHKLLEYQPYGDSEYYKNADDPIDADIIVVDEVSMLGLSTFSKLIAAIKNGCLVLLIGDTNQLESVEPGCVLYDILHCGYVEQCDLREVFRQAHDSLINTNANKIIEGREDLLTGPDFEYYNCDPSMTESLLVEKVQQLIAESGDKNNVQVLAPLKKGTCGINQGNTLLQKIFNPTTGGIWYGFRNYKVGDRVIMRSNNYALNYFNGDIGYIKNISQRGMEIEIGEETVTVPREQYGDMDLAYNCTVHKSQGSEYGFLVIVLQKEARNMLNQNLFYTAVTRAKKKVIIIYEEDLLQHSIRVRNRNTRNSNLIYRINQEMQKALSSRK